MSGFYILLPVGAPVQVVSMGETMGVGLELLQDKVGDSGVVDVVVLGGKNGRSIDMWIDDEGLLRDPPNWNRLRPDGSPLAGTALICASNRAGKSVPLTEAEAKEWAAVVRRWPVAIPMPV